MALKIFHTADIHIGMKFANYQEKQKELSEARINTLKKLVEIANDQNCNLLVIAGDLFDKIDVSNKTVKDAADVIAKFNGNLAVVLPGNHDFLSSESAIWKDFREKQGDRVLLLEEMKPVDLTHYDLPKVVLYPAPCHSKHSDSNNIKWIQGIEKDSSCIHIGIAHGSLEGISPDFDQKYYPMKIDELMNCKLDLWLLGHTHKQCQSQSTIFYPGTPEPDGLDCEHRGTALIVEVDDNKKIKHTPLESTGSYFFSRQTHEIKSENDINNLKNTYTKNHKNAILDLKLTGRIPQELFENLKHLRDEIKNSVFHLHNFDFSAVAKEITIDMINSEFQEKSFPHQLLSKLHEENDSEALTIAYDLIKEVQK